MAMIKSALTLLFVTQQNHIVDLLLLFVFFYGAERRGSRLRLALFPPLVFFYCLSYEQWRFTEYINLIHLVLIGDWIWFYYRFTPSQAFHYLAIYFLIVRVTRFLLLLPYINEQLVDGVALFSDPVFSQLAGRLMISLAKLLAVLLIRQLVPVNQEPCKLSQTAASILLLGIFIFHRSNLLERYDAEASTGADITSVLFGLALLALMLLNEYYFINQTRQHETEQMLLKSRLQYQEAMSRMRRDSDISRLHHDLRHHLALIREIMNDNTKARAYIADIDHTLSEAVESVETGDPMLNAILQERLQKARDAQTAMTVDVDFRQGGFIAPIDVCAIFCNAVDNALEASRQLNDPEKRVIRIYAGEAGNMLLFQVANNFGHDLIWQEDRLVTTKRSNAAIHGIGISSIRHAAEKYGGEVDIQIEQAERFILRVLIPVPEPADNEA